MFAEEKERAATPVDTCLLLLDVSSETALWSSGKSLMGRVMDGNVCTEHLDQIEFLHERIISTGDLLSKLNSSMPRTATLVTAARALVDCFQKCSELMQKSSQLLAMKEEQKQTSERLTQMRALLFTDSDVASIDAAAVRRLRKDALDMQVLQKMPSKRKRAHIYKGNRD